MPAVAPTPLPRALLVLVALGMLASCAPADGAGEGEGEGEEPAVDFGFVFVVDEPTLGFVQAGAVFRPGARRAFDCAETPIAGCVLLECGPDPLELDEVSAGGITIEGALAPIALRFVNDRYTDVNAGPLFRGGEPLRASAEGDVAPGFSLATTAPHPVIINAPPWPASPDALVVDRAAGLHLEWSLDDAPTGELVVLFNTSDQSTELSCAFPASARTADVPAEALLALPAGDGFVDIELRSSAVARADTWQTALTASTHALANDGPAIAGLVLE